MKTIGLASDHAGFELKEFVKQKKKKNGGGRSEWCRTGKKYFGTV